MGGMRIRRLRPLLAATIVAGVLGAGTPAEAARNLLPNPGFEESVLEPEPVPQGTQPQPVMPAGWVFEGASVLFDHSPNARRTGARSVAISGAFGGGSRFCDPNIEGCVANPADPLLDAVFGPLRSYYSVRPAWRTLNPVPIRGGARYTLSIWAAMPTFDPSLLTPGEGAVSYLRWLDADGDTISYSTGPSVLANGSILVWRNGKKTLRAPRNAKSVHVLLGQSDYMTFAQVAFDDVSLVRAK